MYDIGSYSSTSVTFPAEVGLDFYLSDRVALRIATSYSFALTDMLDNYNDKVAKKYGTKSDGHPDIFSFTYFTMNFDLFSDAKTMMIEKMFANVDNWDYEVLMNDQDNDMVFDIWDKCPDTPNGVTVDSTGCPLDADNDGVFDYNDKEQNTPVGATVDDNGVQLNQDKLSEMFEQKNAVSRKAIKLIPVAPIWTRNITFTPGVIPAKFKQVDTDGDGYISFAELLRAVDAYFDEKSDFKTEDVYELNEFFFSQ
jgi:Ca2+-binding EF-hand superfamily protein